MYIFGVHLFHCWHKVSERETTIESHGGLKRQSAWIFGDKCCGCENTRERFAPYTIGMYPPPTR